jgi:ABC-type antimicrobial peptide transport system permease subunit
VSSDALLQLALGIGVGSLATAGSIATADLSAALATSVLLAVATITMIVGLFAAWGPARRALRIDAAEALRNDA